VRSNRSFIRVGKTGSPARPELEIRIAMNKQAKDAYMVYRRRYGIGAIEDKIEINELRESMCMA